MQGDINVFISDYSKGEWGFNDVPNSTTVNHGIDTDLFTPGNLERKPHILSVCNDWIGRDWCCGFKIWERVANGLPVFPVGETKGFSEPALLEALQNSLIIAAGATILATVLGTLTSLATRRRSFYGQSFVDSILNLPLVLPEIVMGLSMLVWFSFLNITLGNYTNNICAGIVIGVPNILTQINTFVGARN